MNLLGAFLVGMAAGMVTAATLIFRHYAIAYDQATFDLLRRAGRRARIGVIVSEGRR